MNETTVSTNKKLKYNSDNDEKYNYDPSNLKSKSDVNKLEDRQVQFALAIKSENTHLFKALHVCCKDIFLDIIHRTIDRPNCYFETFIPLRGVDTFFFKFVCEFISNFLKPYKLKEPCLANRFISLVEDQNNDMTNDTIIKSFILYKLVINKNCEYADYEEFYNRHFEKYISDWRESDFDCFVNNQAFEFVCDEITLSLNPNHIQGSYLITRFIKTYFSNKKKVLLNNAEKRIHRFIDSYEREITRKFVDFLNRYQSYEEVSHIIHYLFNDLSVYCNHEDLKIRNNALELLFSLASSKSISLFDDQLAKILNSLIPSLNKIDWDVAAEDTQSFVESFLKLIRINLDKIKKIIFLNSIIRLQDNEISFLVALAKKQLIPDDFFEELVPYIVSAFKDLTKDEQIKCLQLLRIFADNHIRSENHSFLEMIKNAVITIIDEKTLHEDGMPHALSLLGQFSKHNLISAKEAKCFVQLFLNRLKKPEESVELLQSIIFNLGYLVKARLISQEEAEELLLPVKKTLKNIDTDTKINALWFFANLVTADLITVKKVTSLLSDFKLEEEEASAMLLVFEQDFLLNRSILLELMPLFIPLFNREQEAKKIAFLFKVLLEEELMSLTIIEQLLSFTVEFVEQKVVEFTMSASRYCFAELIKQKLIDVDKILNRMFNHSSNEVQEIGFSCLKYLCKNDLITETVIKSQLLPFIITLIINSQNEKIQKVGFLCLNILITSNSISESCSKELWDLIISKLNNSEIILSEEVMLVLKNFILHQLISAENTVRKKQMSCVISIMAGSNYTLENKSFDFLEASIKKGFIDINIVEIELTPWFVKILRNDKLNEKRYTLLLINSLYNSNLMSKESIEKLIPALKLTFNDTDLPATAHYLLVHFQKVIEFF